MEELIMVLNRQLSNWSVLYVKLHNYHWNVSGPQFFTLHTKFQELYEEAALNVDEIAERILALKGKPVASLKEYLENASVSDSATNNTAEQMVEELIGDYSKVISEIKEGMSLAEQRNEGTTSDMLLAIHTQLEKHVWMLQAFNKK